MSNSYTDDAPPPASLRERLFDAHQRLERWRGRRTISAAKIHELLTPLLGRDVTPTTVGRWLSGAVPPNVEAIRALAQVYGVRFAWLLDGDGEMLPANPAIERLIEQHPNHHAEDAIDFLDRQRREREAKEAEERAAKKKGPHRRAR